MEKLEYLGTRTERERWFRSIAHLLASPSLLEAEAWGLQFGKKWIDDDLARGNANRFLSFIKSQYPDLTAIDHMILSHPHRDHVELLPDIIAAYEVRNFWDSGAVNEICGYRAFIQAISDEPQAVYHSALFDFGSHPVSFPARDCYGQSLPAANITLPYGSRISRRNEHGGGLNPKIAPGGMIRKITVMITGHYKRPEEPRLSDGHEIVISRPDRVAVNQKNLIPKTPFLRTRR